MMDSWIRAADRKRSPNETPSGLPPILWDFPIFARYGMFIISIFDKNRSWRSSEHDTCGGRAELSARWRGAERRSLVGRGHHSPRGDPRLHGGDDDAVHGQGAR